MTGPGLTADGRGLWERLTDSQLDALESGRSVRAQARPRGTDGDWHAAWIDLDGLWIDDPTEPGYVQRVAAWDVTL